MRRRMMMRKQGGLPYPYKQVEYIESTEEQTITLNNYRVEIGDVIENEMALTSYRNRVIIGYFDYPSYTNAIFFRESTNTFLQTCYNGNSNNSEPNLELGAYAKLTLDNNSGKMYSDNLLRKSFYPISFTYPIWLIVNASEKFKSYKHYRNGELIYNPIPCYDTTDPTKHTAGLYDIVNNQFYGNSGTGYFIVGPDI